MDNTVLVSKSSTSTKRSSNKTQGKYKSSSTATKSTGSAPVTCKSKITGMSLIRERLDQHSFSTATKEILLCSWRSGTRKQYNTYLNKWEWYCEEKKLLKLNPGLDQAIETFLTFLFESGLRYSALNTARSALSTILPLFNGIKFGEHPLVCRFLKGVYEQRPALPRYIAIWNVDEVLNYLTTMVHVTELTLKDLTLKLTMLLCLLTAQRCQTVQLFDIKFIQELERKYQVTVQQKLKQSRSGQHLEPIVLLEFVPDRKPCVITHLREYLKRTKSLRRSKLVSTYPFTQLIAVEQLQPHMFKNKDLIYKRL